MHRKYKMKISRLLSEHINANHSYGLSHNLGDSYLCEHNKIYRNIRVAAVKQGYKFSDEVCSASQAYLALPLSQLDAILEAKTIPYLDNVSVIKELEERRPGVIEWDDISDNLRKNFVFHESCHAVARELAKKASAGLKTENKLLHILMEESFANTCELLAVMDANESVHKVFYDRNSYSALFHEITNLKNLQKEIGEDSFTQLIFFGYLHSNYSFNSMDEKHLNRVLNIVTQQSFSLKQIKTIRALLKIGFTLDPRFKEVTSRFYMRLNAINFNYNKLSGFDYFETFEKHKKYNDYVIALASVITT